MSARLLATAAMAVLAASSFAARIALIWAQTQIQPGDQSQVFTHVEPHPSGGFVLAGWRALPNGKKSACVELMGSNGTVQWTRTIPLSGTGSLWTDKVLVLSTGEVYFSAVGDKGMTCKLSSAGSVVNQTFVDEPVQASWLTPEGHAYFAGFTKVSTHPAPNETVDRYTLRSHRLSNVLVRTTTEVPWGEDRQLVNGNLSIDKTRVYSALKYCQSNLGVFLLATYDYNAHDPMGLDFSFPYQGVELAALRYNTAGAVVWTKSYNAFMNEPDSSVTSGGQGLTPSDWPAFNIYSYWARLIPETWFLSPDTGAFTQSLYISLMHQNNQVVNGGLYRIAGSIPKPLDEDVLWTRKYNAVSNAEIWRSPDVPALHRLTFQYIVAQRIVGGVQLRRYRDSDGAATDQLDFTQFGIPYSIKAISQSVSDGSIVLSSVRDLGGGRYAAFISKHNQTPWLNDDSRTTPRNMALNGASVLSNDRLVGGLAPIVTTGPAKGSLLMRADGTFTYTPRPNATGSDSFKYIVRRPGVTDPPPATVFIALT